MKTINKQSVQAFALGIAIAIATTLTGIAVAAVTLGGSASVAHGDGGNAAIGAATLTVSGSNGGSSAAASLNLQQYQENPQMVQYYQKARYYQQGTMTREKYDDGCYYNFNNVDMSDKNNLDQAKTGALQIIVIDPSETRTKVEKIIKTHDVFISRENSTKNSYEVIIQTPVDKFEGIISELVSLVEDMKNLKKIACSENVTIPMINTKNDLQKMQVWTDRYKQIFDLKVTEFDNAHNNDLVRKLRDLEVAEGIYQNYQKQVDALQERFDFLKNVTDHATISIFIVETTEEEKLIVEEDLGQWLTKIFTGNG